MPLLILILLHLQTPRPHPDTVPLLQTDPHTLPNLLIGQELGHMILYGLAGDVNEGGVAFFTEVQGIDPAFGLIEEHQVVNGRAW